MPVSDLAMPQPPEALVTVPALGVATAGQPRAVTCPSCDMPWFGGLELPGWKSKEKYQNKNKFKKKREERKEK